MIFPVIDCSFISLFMRLKAVMGNCNGLTDHTLVISKESQLFHTLCYCSAGPLLFVLPSHTSLLDANLMDPVGYPRGFLQHPDGLGTCLSASALPVRVHAPASEYPTSCHSLTNFIPCSPFFFHFWSPFHRFYLPVCTWPPPKQTTFVIPILLQPFPNSVLLIPSHI